MNDYLISLILAVFSEKCYDEYFLRHNFLDVPCLKSTFSKVLGIGIIAGSILVKVPQILKILNSKSAKGISIYGVYLELFAITSNFAYSYVMSFPFSAWGEGTFLAFQTAIIAALVLHYGGSPTKASLFLATYVGIVWALASGFTPIRVLWNFQAINVPIIVFAKAIQVIANYQNGGTGQLSALTCILLLGGSIARIFTSVQETGDSIVVLTYSVSTLSNGVLVAQLLWYWNADKNKNKNKKKKKRT